MFLWTVLKPTAPAKTDKTDGVASSSAVVTAPPALPAPERARV
jgi:hypothetical protein